MKTIGIIGGISWLSSIDYYRLLNQMVSERTKDTATAKIILYSLNFGEVRTLTAADNWNALAGITCDAAKNLSKQVQIVF